jgi:hypothetical protein
MTLSALGIFSAAGAGGVDLGSYELISSTILATATASIVFDVSSLGSTYKHLQLRYTARNTNSTSEYSSFLRLNADSGSNYTFHQLGGQGSSVYSTGAGNTTSLPMTNLPGSTYAANAFNAGVLDLLDAFSTTKNKTSRNLGGYVGSPNNITVFSGVWRNTAATTSLTCSPEVGTYAIGTRFSLYGIKG